jgi:hypothetical protein
VTLNVLNPVDTSIAQANPTGTLRHDKATNTIDFSTPVAILGPAIVFLNEKPDTGTASTAYGAFSYFEF